MIPDEVKEMLKEMIKSKWTITLILIGAVIAAYLSLILLPKDNPIE